MTHLDSQRAHGRRLLVIMTSPRDPQDQYAISGIARWDGASLWLDRNEYSEPVLLTNPGARLLLIDITTEIGRVLRESIRNVAMPASWVTDADCLALAPLDRMPDGAVAVPGAVAPAHVPEWKPGEPAA